jgi:hypothetical protein
MSIIYIAIVRDFSKTLCEYVEYNGNFPQICSNILKQHKDTTQQEVVVEYEDYYFFMLNFDRLTIIALLDSDANNQEVLVFMTCLKEKLLKKYSLDELMEVAAFRLKEFIPIIKTQVLFYEKGKRKKSKIPGIFIFNFYEICRYPQQAY